MENDKLIRYDGNLIKRVGNAITTTNKLLAISERQKIISFLVERPEFFISLISKYYPLNEALLRKYSTIWNWELISLNKTILWSDKIIEKYSPLFNWKFLCQNSGIQWGNGLLEKYETKIEWIWLSANETFPSNEEMVEKYFDNWDWEVLSQNHGLPWEAEFIEKYKEKWNWNKLSENEGLSWSFELIDKFLNYWNWGSLSRLCPFPIQLINKYQNYVNWNSLKWNNKFQWNSETTKRFNEIGNKMGMLYTFPFNIDMIEVYKNRESGLWQCLSLNSNLPWSFELIDKYKENWDWDCLSLNSNIPWSLELIEKYKENWNWECLFMNKTIPWSLQMLDKFKSKGIDFYSQKNYALYNTKWDFTETNIYNYKSLWDKVFNTKLDDSQIDEAIGQNIYAYENNNYILKKLDEVYGEIEFVLYRLDSSYGAPHFSWMFLGIGHDDIFQVKNRISKFIGRYSFLISNDLRTILIELNLFLNDICSGIKKNKITQMELRAIGSSVFEITQSFKKKLELQYQNDSKPTNILLTLNRINEHYRN